MGHSILKTYLDLIADLSQGFGGHGGRLNGGCHADGCARHDVRVLPHVVGRRACIKINCPGEAVIRAGEKT